MKKRQKYPISTIEDKQKCIVQMREIIEKQDFTIEKLKREEKIKTALLMEAIDILIKRFTT